MKNRLKVLRAKRDWSQATLAQQLSVSRQTINAIETGKYSPSLELAFAIGRLFDMQIEELFDPEAEQRAQRQSLSHCVPLNPRNAKMKKRELSDEIVLTDAEARDVIERAVRVLPERDGITVADLREIAAELDIDPRALEAALDQVIGLPVPGHPVRSWLKRHAAKLGRVTDSILPQNGRLIGSAIFGGIAGWLNAFLMVFSVNGHYSIATAMVGVTVANLLSRRLDRNYPRYLAETFATWGAYGALWSITYGHVTPNLIAWLVLWTSLATVMGFFLVRDSSRSGGAPHFLSEAIQQGAESESSHAKEMCRSRYSMFMIAARA